MLINMCDAFGVMVVLACYKFFADERPQSSFIAGRVLGAWATRDTDGSTREPLYA